MTSATSRPPLIASPTICGAKNKPGGTGCGVANPESVYLIPWRRALTLHQETLVGRGDPPSISPDPGGTQPGTDAIKQMVGANHIAAPRRDGSPGILDQASHGHVCSNLEGTWRLPLLRTASDRCTIYLLDTTAGADLTGLLFVRELPIAIVHQHKAVFVHFLDNLYDPG